MTEHDKRNAPMARCCSRSTPRLKKLAKSPREKLGDRFAIEARRPRSQYQRHGDELLIRSASDLVTQLNVVDPRRRLQNQLTPAARYFKAEDGRVGAGHRIDDGDPIGMFRERAYQVEPTIGDFELGG